jgi:hypothetical protein
MMNVNYIRGIKAYKNKADKDDLIDMTEHLVAQVSQYLI